MATIVLGLAFVVVGLIVIPFQPHFQLDAVLLESELSDDTVRKATLALLKQASGNRWMFWTAAGILQIAIGGVGLQANPPDRTPGRSTA